MKWKCWNTKNPDTIYEIESDSLDDACRKSREFDSEIDAFKPKGDENNE